MECPSLQCPRYPIKVCFYLCVLKLLLKILTWKPCIRRLLSEVTPPKSAIPPPPPKCVSLPNLQPLWPAPPPHPTPTYLCILVQLLWHCPPPPLPAT